MRLLVDGTDALDRIRELGILAVLPLFGTHRDVRGDAKARFMLEGALHLLVLLERDVGLLPVVVRGADDALRADDEAARLRHRAERRHDLRHEIGLGLLVAVVPVQLDFRQRHAGAHAALAGGIRHFDQ